MKTFATLVKWINEDKQHGYTIKGYRLSLAAWIGKVPAIADMYCPAKEQFFNEPAEYQIAACLAIQQIGD